MLGDPSNHMNPCTCGDPPIHILTKNLLLSFPLVVLPFETLYILDAYNMQQYVGSQ